MDHGSVRQAAAVLAVSAGQSPENGAGVLTLQANAQGLLHSLGDNSRWLTGADGDKGCDAAQSADECRAKATPTSLENEGHKLDALLTALVFGGLMGAFLGAGRPPSAATAGTQPERMPLVTARSRAAGPRSFQAGR